MQGCRARADGAVMLTLRLSFRRRRRCSLRVRGRHGCRAGAQAGRGTAEGRGPTRGCAGRRWHRGCSIMGRRRSNRVTRQEAANVGHVEILPRNADRGDRAKLGRSANRPDTHAARPGDPLRSPTLVRLAPARLAALAAQRGLAGLDVQLLDVAPQPVLAGPAIAGLRAFLGAVGPRRGVVVPLER